MKHRRLRKPVDLLVTNLASKWSVSCFSVIGYDDILKNFHRSNSSWYVCLFFL